MIGSQRHHIQGTVDVIDPPRQGLLQIRFIELGVPPATPVGCE